MTSPLLTIIRAHKHGKTVGLPSVCSANPFVMEAALTYARTTKRGLCIESTARQVNQDGGYAGMTPSSFADRIHYASGDDIPIEHNVILGGDHLGPDPWRHENAESAMAKARDLVRQCVLAGYRKLHLDPTKPCRDDLRDGFPGLPLKTIAERTAALCESAEAAAKETGAAENDLCYVVGAEVPTPGGVSGKPAEIRVSTVDDVQEMIGAMNRAFLDKGLEAAWHRCVAVVVESGAGFGPDAIYDYDRQKTRALKAFIEKEKNLVFEAHSTDFQQGSVLADMVRDHFVILKVGPWLTFTAREAIYALTHVEREWLGNRKGVTLSRLPDLMQKKMQEDPTHWRDHYSGDASYLNYINAFGFSDRMRYYWSLPDCTAAIANLFQNLRQYGIPLPLLSQYMPDLYESVREGRIPCTPHALIQNKIKKILDKYANACGEGLAEETS